MDVSRLSILGIDPGLNCTGLAWQVDGVVDACSVRSKGRGLIPKTHSIIKALKENEWAGFLEWALIVIEKPQVYKGHLQKGDPNDLVDLAVLIGNIMAHLNYDKLFLPTPREWKGQVPKDIHHARLKKIVQGLGRQSKDAMDAVGLLLYGKERLQYANA